MGKHIILKLQCQNCKQTFNRKRCEHVKRNPNYIRCPLCVRRDQGKMHTIPTKMIKEILANDGRTNTGRDYGMYIEELKEILYNRENKQLEKSLKDASKHLTNEEDNIYVPF